MRSAMAIRVPKTTPVLATNATRLSGGPVGARPRAPTAAASTRATTPPYAAARRDHTSHDVAPAPSATTRSAAPIAMSMPPVMTTPDCATRQPCIAASPDPADAASPRGIPQRFPTSSTIAPWNTSRLWSCSLIASSRRRGRPSRLPRHPLCRLERLHLEGVADRPQQREPDPRLVEVIGERPRVSRALDAHDGHAEIGAGPREGRGPRDPPLPFLRTRDPEALVVGDVGVLRFQAAERQIEVGLLAPETGDGLKQGPRRGRRPEVERAAIQVVAESIADELGLADDERPGEERLDRLAEAVHVLGRDAVVVVVPGVALAHPGGIARGASYALAAPGPEMVRENSP